MSQIDALIAKYNGCVNWITHYQERGNRDDAPKHLAALAAEQREVAIRIIGELMSQHQIRVSEIQVAELQAQEASHEA